MDSHINGIGVKGSARRSIPSFASFGKRKRHNIVDQEHLALKIEKSTPSQRCTDSLAKSEISSQHPNAAARKKSNYSQNIWPPLSDDLRPLANETSPSHKLFVVDRRPDSQNLYFHAPSTISHYSRFGAGAIVGLQRCYKIDETIGNQTKTSLLTTTSNSERPLRDAQSISQPSVEVAVKRAAHNDTDDTADFLPFGFSVSAVDGSEASGTFFALSGQNVSQMAGGHLAMDAWSLQNSFDSLDTDICDQAASRMERSMRHHGQLNLRDDTTSRESHELIDLIRRQNCLIIKSASEAERQINKNIKILMCKKALAMEKRPKYYEIYLTEMMETASEIWETEKLSSYWKNLIAQELVSPQLWLIFLNFTQSSFSVFKFENTMRAYEECMRQGRSQALRSEGTGKAHDEIEEIQVLMLLRLTLFMRESGFSEQALALWQALLEIEYFRPLVHQNLQDIKVEDVASDFEAFWESQVPLIGESGATGWNESYIMEGDISVTNIQRKDTLSSGSSDSTWITQERQHILRSRQPARTLEEAANGDPHRIVLYSDIHPFLAVFSTTDGRQKILQAFLSFCQLPPCKASSPTTAWAEDGFLVDTELYADVNELEHRMRFNNGQDALDGDPKYFRVPFVSSIAIFQIDTMTLFADQSSWFSAFGHWPRRCQEGRNAVDGTWVLRALEGLASMDKHDDDLAVYLIALELLVNPDLARSTAKRMLSERPSSLRLYNAYALVEYRLQNPRRAEKTLVTAINMSRTLSINCQQDSILLWRTWAWESLCTTDESEEALSRLSCYGNLPIEPASLQTRDKHLRSATKTQCAGQALAAFRDEMFSLKNFAHAALAAECLILLAYSKDTSTLSTANQVYRMNMRALCHDNVLERSSQESLRQAYARLLFHHEDPQDFISSGTRDLFAENESLFPSNTMFYSLRAWSESRYSYSDRIRFVVEDVVHGKEVDLNLNTNVNRHLLTIHTALVQNVDSSSKINSVRSAFERAIASKVGTHCASLWKMFYLFERCIGAFKRAKVVFYSGIKACPWAKELYLLPFEHPLAGHDGISDADLKSIYHLMVEKGLRIHTSMCTSS